MVTKWRLVVSLYVKDLQFVQSEYNEQKENPPLARNLPPISGKITWSRQLYRRITGPIEVMKKHPDVMEMAETKKAIKGYNRLARVLVEYEIVFLNLWSAQLEKAEAGLSATILIREPEGNRLLINFDTNINELLREIEVVEKLGMELSPNARLLKTKGEDLKEKYQNVTVSIIIPNFIPCTYT